MSTKGNSARNVSSDKKSCWKFTAKVVVLSVIGVSIVLQLAVFATKRYTKPYSLIEFTQSQIVAGGVNPGGTGSERMVGTVVEKLEHSKTNVRTTVTKHNGSHRTGSKEGFLSNNISKTTDGVFVSKPVSSITRTNSLREAPSIVGKTRQVPSSIGVGSEAYLTESVLKPAPSLYAISTPVSVQAFKINSSSERHYRILIYGTKDMLAQKLDFLYRQNGTWRKEISCGVNVTIDVHVGNATGDFEGQNAVVFNMDEIAVARAIEKLIPMQTSIKQAWIYYGREPAVRLRQMFRGCGHLPLHGIWSFQHDSEVLMNYGSFAQTTPMTSKKQSASFWSRGKTKLVAWMARNCRQTFWPRTKFVKSLKKYIPVDIYGTCGTLECPVSPIQECRNKLSNYKFYLALESAECEDYITEKMWENALANGIVPVVYGAPKATYLKQAPPHSYIYVGDFNSTEALAEYLKMLDKKPNLYAKYFEWRYKGHIQVSKRAGEPVAPNLFCSLVPFISKVEKGYVERKTFSEFPFYKSCRLLKGKEVGLDYRPPLKNQAKHWKLNW